MDCQITGKIGEKIAEDFLKKKNYKILQRNYFYQVAKGLKKGEIDIVAQKEDKIVFVEVKTLKNPSITIWPEEKINLKKKKKLIESAQVWLMKNKVPFDSKWQIDILAILIDGKEIKIQHFENAISDI